MNDYLNTYPFDKMSEAVLVKTGENIIVTLANGEEMWYKFNTDIPDAHPHGNPGEYLLYTDYCALHTVTVFSHLGDVIYTADNNLGRPNLLTLESDKLYFIRVKFEPTYEAPFCFSLDYINQTALLEEGMQEATPIPCKCPVVGELSAQDSAWYSFIADKSAHIDNSSADYRFEVSSTTGLSIITYNETGAELERASNGKLSIPLDYGNKYYVCVKNVENNTSTFTLKADWDCADTSGTNPESAIELSLPESISLPHCCLGDEHWFKFTTNNPDAHISGNIGEYTFNISCSSALEFKVYDSDKNLVETLDSSCDSGNSLELLYDKTYYLCVTAPKSHLGSFSCSINYVDQRSLFETGFASAEFIDIWQPGVSAGAEVSADSYRWFNFIASGFATSLTDEPTHEYRFFFSGEKPFEAALFNANGKELRRTYSEGGFVPHDITLELEDGLPYYIGIRAPFEDTYVDLLIDYDIPTPPTGESKELAYTIKLCENRHDSFSSYMDEIWYKFTPDSSPLHPNGGASSYRITATALNNLTATLYDSNDNVVAPHNVGTNPDECRSECEYMLNFGETYYLNLSAPGNMHYYLCVDTESIPASGDSAYYARPLNLNSRDEGSFTVAGAPKWYRFTASKSCLSILGKSSVEIYGTLYDVYGNYICSDNYYPIANDFGKHDVFAINARDLSVGGTYYISICPKSEETGTYEIRLSDSVIAEGVEADPKNVMLEIGETVPLNAVPIPSHADAKFSWFTRNTDIISLNEKTGEVTGKALGRATVCVRTESGNCDYFYIIVGTHVTSITIRTSTVEFCVNECCEFKANILPSNATYKNVTWQSSDPTVANFEKDGILRAKKPGQTTITATATESALFDTCVVTVVLSPFGAVKYNGEIYPIEVPVNSGPSFSPYWETVLTYNLYKDTSMNRAKFFSGLNFDDFGGIFDASKPYIKEIACYDKLPLAALTVGLLGVLNAFANALNTIQIVCVLQRSGSAKRALIQVFSSEHDALFQQFATGDPISAYFKASGNPLQQHGISNSAKDLYKQLTGITGDLNGSYDILFTLDENHKKNQVVSYLWIRSDGTVMETPNILPNDKLEIVKLKGFLNLDHDTLLDVPLIGSVPVTDNYQEIFQSNLTILN